MNEKAFNPDPMFRQRKPIGTQPERAPPATLGESSNGVALGRSATKDCASRRWPWRSLQRVPIMSASVAELRNRRNRLATRNARLRKNAQEHWRSEHGRIDFGG